MKTYKTATRDSTYVTQSRVIHGNKADRIGQHSFSLQIARRKSCFGKTERRGWNLWLYLGPLRIEVGTR